jgi:flagellar basal body P-ring protein FlgI
MQGPVSVGGFSLGGGDAGSVQKNHTVVGNIPNGGLVTAGIERLQDMDGHIELLLFEGKGNCLIRAQDIILELMCALDQQLLDDGNELALNLQRLYL